MPGVAPALRTGFWTALPSSSAAEAASRFAGELYPQHLVILCLQGMGLILLHILTVSGFALL